MILAIDIGNTNIVVGCIEEEKIYFIERISTNHTKTELEYAIDLKTILDIHHIKRSEIEGAIISSVVPQITNAAKLAVEKILKKEPMVLGPGVKTGLNIVLDNPGEMGADRVADAVAALAQYPVPLVIVDMGTATTISVLDDKKRYIGGMILPGVRISLDALTSRASQLSGISIETAHWKKYGRLHEERDPLWKRSCGGRYRGQDRRRTWTESHRDRNRWNVQKDYSSLQKRDDLGWRPAPQGTSDHLRQEQIIKISNYKITSFDCVKQQRK